MGCNAIGASTAAAVKMGFSTEIPVDLLSHLRTAQKVAVLTGAGISAESGVPTFRESQTGLWARYDPQELATPQSFQRDPRLVWEWYTWRRDLVSRAKPNPGHYALAELEQWLTGQGTDFTLITQNVDGLHRRAGSVNLVELHGDITRTKCFAEGVVVESCPETEEVPPRCPRCGGLLRPDVVWFGENLPAEALETAWAAAQSAGVFFSIGTSTVVQPAASLPLVALEHGATVIEVNPDQTPLSSLAQFRLSGPAGFILPKLLKHLKND
jgi:NAD-dependent deacetylase